MTMTLSSFSLSSLIAQWRQPAVAQRPSPPRSEADLARMNRAVIHDMMSYHPKAMQSEMNLLLLQTRFPTLF